MLDKERNKGEKYLRYRIIQCKNKGSFDALNYIIDNVILLQLMNLIENVNHTVIIVGK